MPNPNADRHATPPTGAADRDTDDAVVSSSALDAADAAFRLLCTGPEPLALDCSRLGRGLPQRVAPLTELRDVLLDRDQPVTDAAREAVWRELVIAAQTEDPAWVLGAVGVAMPGLRVAAGKLATGYTGDIDDLDAEVLAGFTARLKAIDPDAGKLAARLVWAAQRAGAKLRASEWDYAARVVLRQAESFPPPDPDHGHEDLVLAEAVRDGALTEFEARLIGSTRVEGIHVAEAADALGLSYWQVYRAREKAESALLSYLEVPRPERKTKKRGKKAA